MSARPPDVGENRSRAVTAGRIQLGAHRAFTTGVWTAHTGRADREEVGPRWAFQNHLHLTAVGPPPMAPQDPPHCSQPGGLGRSWGGDRTASTG